MEQMFPNIVFRQCPQKGEIGCYSCSGIVFSFCYLTGLHLLMSRISITFRKMDESKQPLGFVADPDLLGIQPTKFDNKVSRSWRSSKPQGIENRRASVDGGREQDREYSNRSSRSQRNRSGRNKSRPSNNHRELE